MNLNSTWGKVISSVLAALVGVNAFFISRLVATIDSNIIETQTHSVQLARIQTEVESLKERLEHFARRLDREARLDKEAKSQMASFEK